MGIHRELKKKINSYKQKGASIHALAIKALEKDQLNVEQQRAHVIMEILQLQQPFKHYVVDLFGFLPYECE